MLARARVVGRALEREVERELHPVLVQRRDERREVSAVPSSGMDRVVPALGATDRPGATDVARLRPLGVVRAPCGSSRPIGWIGGQVDDVEAELGELGHDLGRRRRSRPTSAGRARTRRSRRARSRSTSTSSGALLRARRAGRRAPSPAAAARHSSTEPSPKSTAPSASSPARSCLPGRDLAVVLVEPARRTRSTQATTSKRYRPDRVDGERAAVAVVAERTSGSSRQRPRPRR